jgi:Pup-ligase protein.
MSLDRELDWVIKRSLIESYMAKHVLEWSDSRVAMIDLQYHDIRPGKGCTTSSRSPTRWSA